MSHKKLIKIIKAIKKKYKNILNIIDIHTNKKGIRIIKNLIKNIYNNYNKNFKIIDINCNKFKIYKKLKPKAKGKTTLIKKYISNITLKINIL